MKYFTLTELTRSDTAEKMHIDNTPNNVQIKALEQLVNNVLDPAREKLGSPIRVTSGFRCDRLNKLVGGARNSSHTKGQATDITCYDNLKLIRILQNLTFDQLIWEKGKGQPLWIHVSFSNRNRRQKLKTYDGKNYVTVEKF